MDLHDSVAVVTGSNRGLGREFAAQLLERGAKKVYATARNPESVQIAGVTPLGLDITDPDPSPGRPRLPATHAASSTTPAYRPARV
jgi:Dehydrogenases with different specificities (related to short-chain alcohol dehydrogenases)